MSQRLGQKSGEVHMWLVVAPLPLRLDVGTVECRRTSEPTLDNGECGCHVVRSPEGIGICEGKHVAKIVTEYVTAAPCVCLSSKRSHFQGISKVVESPTVRRSACRSV